MLAGLAVPLRVTANEAETSIIGSKTGRGLATLDHPSRQIRRCRLPGSGRRLGRMSIPVF